jgi:hypothetical protein
VPLGGDQGKPRTGNLCGGRTRREGLAAGVLVVAASQLRGKRHTADLAVQDIHAQIKALDPVTRAGVVNRLTSDTVKELRSQGH